MNERAAPALWRRPAALAWCALLTLETLCQVSLKLAGEHTGAFDFSLAAVRSALSTVWLWVGIACYASAFLVWMTILRKSSLSGAFPTSAIALVTVMLASWLIFAEHVSWLQALGGAIIVAGIVLLGPDASESRLVPELAPEPADNA